ncbi:MAG: S8 family serine peptidase, partial [Defluviitaleaceae bacterium]|nr:S8 family serine peptidase [Defluviitaleaceae bacterium]
MPTDYEIVSLYEYAQMPDVIDIIIRYSSRFREYAATRPYIKIGKVFTEGWALTYIPSNMLDTIVRDLNESYVPIMPRGLNLLGRASLISSGILQVQQRPYMDLKGRGVLLGFIDTGIDYTKNTFRYEDGRSKIKFIWDQTVKTEAKGRIYIGTEYTQEQITAALENGQSLVHKDEIGHGTFLASVAGGREDSDFLGAAPDAEIIMVKLRRLNDYYKDRFRIPPHEEDVYSSTDLMLGIQYIFDKAQELDRPVSICIALGTNFGAHDGSSVTEDFVSNLAKIRGVAINIAGGNESNSHKHTQGRIEATGGEYSFEVRVSERANPVAIYVWSLPQDSMYLTVKSPTGEVVSRRPGIRDEIFSQKLVLEKSNIS